MLYLVREMIKCHPIIYFIMLNDTKMYGMLKTNEPVKYLKLSTCMQTCAVFFCVFYIGILIMYKTAQISQINYKIGLLNKQLHI